MSTYHYMLHKRGAGWQVCIRDARGRRIKRTNLGPMTRKEADQKMQAMIGEHTLHPNARHISRTPKLHEWLDRYLYLRKHEVRSDTLASQGRGCDLLREYFMSTVLLEDITPSSLSDWRVWLIEEQGLKETTVCKHCATAKVIFKRAKAEGVAVSTPAEHLKSTPPKTDPHCRRIVSEKSIKAACLAQMFGETYEREIAPILLICYYAGLRLSEAIHLKWSDISEDMSRLTVRPREGEITSKQRTRIVRLEPDLKPWLHFREMKRMPQLDETVAGLIESGRQGMVHKMLRRAGADFTFKDLRVARANAWMEAGFPEPVICAWMGHTAAVSADHYRGVPEIFYEEVDQ